MSDFQTLFSRLLVYSSILPNLLLIPSDVFCISVILFFSSVWVLSIFSSSFELQIGTCQEHCQWLNNKGICNCLCRAWTLCCCRCEFRVEWGILCCRESVGTQWSCSVVSNLCPAPRTAANQVPLSMEFSRQEYWNELPFPSPDLPDPGTEPQSPSL